MHISVDLAGVSAVSWNGLTALLDLAATVRFSATQFSRLVSDYFVSVWLK
jgi:hypothetical protein